MLLQILIIGIFMGIFGQGARALVGLKGLSVPATAQGPGSNDVFGVTRLLMSFLIGILVGIASALVYLKGFDRIADAQLPEWTTLMTWAVAAYAGTDALEGFISNYLSPSASGSTGQMTVADVAVKAPVLPAPVSPAPTPPASLDPKTVVYNALAIMGRTDVQDGKKLKPDLKFKDLPDYLGLLSDVNTVIVTSSPGIPSSRLPTMATAVSWSNDDTTTVGNVVSDVATALSHASV
jgi:hypothetical protein